MLYHTHQIIMHFFPLFVSFFFLVLKKRWNEARKYLSSFAYLINIFCSLCCWHRTEKKSARLKGCSTNTPKRTLFGNFPDMCAENIFFSVLFHDDGFVPNPSKYLNNVLNKRKKRKRFNLNLMFWCKLALLIDTKVMCSCILKSENHSLTTVNTPYRLEICRSNNLVLTQFGNGDA